MKNKKLLLLLLVLVAPLLFLVACENAVEPETAETQPTVDEPDTADENGEPTVDEHVIYLDFWHAMTGPHEAALTTLIDAFHHAYPHIRIRAEYQGSYADINTLIMGSAMAGTLPHMAQQTTDNITGYVNDGILLPLTALFNDPDNGLSQDEMDDIIAVFREGVIWDGEFMSVPLGKSTRVLYYNIDLLEAYDVEVPTTWEALIEVAQILTNPDENRFGMGFENGWGTEFIALTLQHGGAYIDEVTEIAHFGAQPGIDAARFVMDLHEAGYARFAGEDNFLSGVFGNGFVAMYIGSSTSMPHVASAVDGAFEWSTAVLPTYNGNAATRFQGNDIVLFDNGMSEEEQHAAWTFMAFTLRPEVTAQWAMDSGYIPVTYSGRHHPIFTDFLLENPQAAAPSDQFDAGFMTARSMGANQVWQILGEELGNIRLGLYDIETALTRAQERANEALAD
ncbi:MAG: ABC transporter substrate-binding protein [Defluviitaleaceae bacterium]|nr:ABC transporter substrate-binding protein [Defluviitaleaceae bacterium]